MTKFCDELFKNFQAWAQKDLSVEEVVTWPRNLWFFFEYLLLQTQSHRRSWQFEQKCLVKICVESSGSRVNILF